MAKKNSKPLTPGQKSFFAKIFPLIFVAVGIATLIFVSKGIALGKASLGWPETEGKILSSKVGSRRSSKNKSTRYSPKISYQYSVNEQDFTGNKIRIGGISSTNHRKANTYVKRYPAGKAVAVYYDPQDPATALLESGIGTHVYVALGSGVAFTLAGIAMFIFLPIAIKKQDQLDALAEH